MNAGEEIIISKAGKPYVQEEQRKAMTEDLRREILIGVKQLDGGKSVFFDESVVADIKSSARSKIVS